MGPVTPDVSHLVAGQNGRIRASDTEDDLGLEAQVSIWSQTVASPPSPASAAETEVWAQLAHRVAASASMKLIDPASNRSSRGRRLSKRPPSQPAAVPIYDRNRRTDKLVFDLDSKVHGRAAVTADAARLCAWLAECGGRWISDHNPGNGGRHVIVPLAYGEAFRLVNVEPLMRLLATRLPTLDLAPMLNEKTGGITPPGSRTRDGHFRQLDGSIEEALDVLNIRSQPRLVARLRALLGDTILRRSPAPAGTEHVAGSRGISKPAFWEGVGPQSRLRSEWKLTSPMPAVPRAFAIGGQLPSDGRYRTPSEARQSVLAAGALRGMCLDDVRERMRSTDDSAWSGLARSYKNKYGSRAARRLTQDWNNACRWASLHIEVLRSPGHKKTRTHTPPCRGLVVKSSPRSSDTYDVWLASATDWVHSTWPRQAYRWTVLAVLQALAYAAKLKGEKGGDGTPLVEVGVRSLSLFAGLMPPTTIADVLADIRDLPGSPIHRVRRAAGILADRYSLVRARRYDEMEVVVAAVHTERVRVEQVHDAWRVLGLNKRLVYELVSNAGLSRPTDIFAAAHIGTRTGYDILAALKQAGLLRCSRGEVTLGTTTLDDIVHRHGLSFERAELVAQYRAERRDWRRWLDIRFGVLADHAGDRYALPPPAPWDLDKSLNEAIWAVRLANGPPAEVSSSPFPHDLDFDSDRDNDLVALALLQDALGAVVLTT